jgi:flagellar basal-body rod protein FlgB
MIGGLSMTIFSNSLNHLESALNVATQTQRTIASNIANVDTPNYKSKQVLFEAHLSDALQKNTSSTKTNDKHFAFSTENSSHTKMKVVENKSTTFNSNGNNVDIDHEMSQLAQNQLWYNFLVDKTNSKINNLRSVIKGGS